MHCGREVNENIIISHNFTLNNFCVCVECVYSLICFLFFLMHSSVFRSPPVQLIPFEQVPQLHYEFFINEPIKCHGHLFDAVKLGVTPWTGLLKGHTERQLSVHTHTQHQSDQWACLSKCGRKPGYLETSHTEREANS